MPARDLSRLIFLGLASVAWESGGRAANDYYISRIPNELHYCLFAPVSYRRREVGMDDSCGPANNDGDDVMLEQTRV